MSRFKSAIKKNEYLYTALKVLKNIKRGEFRDKIIKIDKDPNVLYVEHFGECNKSVIIYHIYSNSQYRGFFSLFLLVLDGLFYADEFGLVPVVEFGENTLYSEAVEVNNSKNSFEYYFEPVSDIDYFEATASKNVIKQESIHRLVGNKDFDKTVGMSLYGKEDDDFYFTSRADMMKKYIRFKPQVKDYVENSIRSLWEDGKKVLGIHVRGTDMNKGYKGHAKPVSEDEYLTYAEQAIEKNDFEYIFLATDQESTIEKFKEKFGNKLLYYKEVFRSNDGEAIHFSNNSRDLHKYNLGLEVLRDAYSLAACDGLIAGVSNVSIAARIIKRSENKAYDYVNIVNHGFNTSGVSMKKQR